jgi:hypothetical protein
VGLGLGWGPAPLAQGYVRGAGAHRLDSASENSTLLDVP